MWLHMVFTSTNKYVEAWIYVLFSRTIPISNNIATLCEFTHFSRDFWLASAISPCFPHCQHTLTGKPKRCPMAHRGDWPPWWCCYSLHQLRYCFHIYKISWELKHDTTLPPSPCRSINRWTVSVFGRVCDQTVPGSNPVWVAAVWIYTGGFSNACKTLWLCEIIPAPWFCLSPIHVCP